jgi:hypothetical protein
VKLAEERVSPEYSTTGLVSSRYWVERAGFPRQERKNITSDMQIILPDKPLMKSA